MNKHNEIRALSNAYSGYSLSDSKRELHLQIISFLYILSYLILSTPAPKSDINRYCLFSRYLRSKLSMVFSEKVPYETSWNPQLFQTTFLIHHHHLQSNYSPLVTFISLTHLTHTQSSHSMSSSRPSQSTTASSNASSELWRAMSKALNNLIQRYDSGKSSFRNKQQPSPTRYTSFQYASGGGYMFRKERMRIYIEVVLYF